MKYTTITTLAALLLGSAGVYAQSTAYTPPSGFVTVDVTPAASAGETATTAFSVTLRNTKKYTGQATAVLGQTVTVADATWTPTTEWATSGTPHLLYIATATGVESFLITANTADTITVAASIELETRFANDADIFIVEAATIGGLFGETTEDVKLLQSSSSSEADNLYLWSGTAWQIYWYNGSNWTKDSFSNSNDDVIFPDDGVFLIRRGTDALSFVFTGAVPTENQVTSIPSGSTFIGSKYPVDTQIQNMGFLDLENWKSAGSLTDADAVYVWSGTAWQTYWHNGSNWTKDSFSNNNADVIAGNSAMFVLKSSAGDGAVESDIPYDLGASE